MSIKESKRRMFFTVIINKEDSWYVAKCIENNVASQGKTRKEALANLKKAIELYPRLLVQ